MKVSFVTKAVGIALGGTLLAAQGAQAQGGSQHTSPERDSTPCSARLVSAHEGVKTHADGDTVQSQVDAFKIGSNIADTDVWVTKDGYIVEMHDNDVSHSTNGTGLITQMTLDQVLALRTRGHNDPIPTLDDSLAIPMAHEDGRYLMMETKYAFQNQANLRQLASQIDAAGMTSHVIIYSAYINQVRYLKQIDPGLTVWFKATSLPPPDQVEGLNGVMLPLADITPDVVNQFHAVGVTVIQQRLDETKALWQQFVSTGADGLMTDTPKQVIGWCRQLG